MRPAFNRFNSAPALLLAALLSSGCESLKARLLAQEGVNLYRHGRVAEAADRFQAAVALDPYIAAIQLNLGFANLALYQAEPLGEEGARRAQQAIFAFERYLQLRPGEERAHVYLLQTFVDTGRYEEAVAYFKPLVEKSPPDPEALATLGTIAAKTGRAEEASRWYALAKAQH